MIWFEKKKNARKLKNKTDHWSWDHVWPDEQEHVPAVALKWAKAGSNRASMGAQSFLWGERKDNITCLLACSLLFCCAFLSRWTWIRIDLCFSEEEVNLGNQKHFLFCLGVRNRYWWGLSSPIVGLHPVTLGFNVEWKHVCGDPLILSISEFL